MTTPESIRLEKFRQLKGEIRGSQEYLVVGIDVAEEKHHAFLGTATGKSLLRRLVFDNSREGFETLLHRSRAVMTQEGRTKVVYGLEPTADYHKPLGEFLVKNGYPVVLELAGLDLSASCSGKNSARVTPRISKKGKAELRYALYQSTLIATFRNKCFIEYFSRLIAGREREQGIKTKMRIKVAAKILVIAWTLWKKGEMFQSKYLWLFVISSGFYQNLYWGRRAGR
jgi:transposase